MALKASLHVVIHNSLQSLVIQQSYCILHRQQRWSVTSCMKAVSTYGAAVGRVLCCNFPTACSWPLDKSSNQEFVMQAAHLYTLTARQQGQECMRRMTLGGSMACSAICFCSSWRCRYSRRKRRKPCTPNRCRITASVSCSTTRPSLFATRHAVCYFYTPSARCRSS